LVLASAFCLQKRWERPFPKDKTKLGSFYLNSGDTIKVPMMYNESVPGAYGRGGYQYVRMEGFQALSISGNFIVLLPDRIDGLEELEARLTRDLLKKTIVNLKGHTVRLTLPKFQAVSASQLRALMAPLGLKNAFNHEQADLSGIVETEQRLALSQAIHKTSIEVNEDGVGAVLPPQDRLLMSYGEPEPTPPIDFKIDRPFLYMLDGLGAPFFLGRMINPSKGIT